jgi:Cft2 family RNA processing exonuclease
MNLYMSNPVIDEYIRKGHEKYAQQMNELEEISLEKKNSDNIHVVFIDNWIHTTNRETIVTTITNLLNTNQGDHFVLVVYGYTIRCIGPILQLDKSIIKLVSKIIQIGYDGTPRYRKDDIKELVQTKSIMNEPCLEFLKSYDSIFYYE